MTRFLRSAATHIIGNAVGLLVATLLLTGFSIDPLGFVIVVLVFTGVEVLAMPLLTKVSEKNVPQLMGGIALVTTFVGLLITDLAVPGLTVGGISNLLAATLLVWLGALIVGILLPVYVFKDNQDSGKG